MQLNSIIILQSKIDLVKRSKAENHREQIIDFIQSKIMLI